MRISCRPSTPAVISIALPVTDHQLSGSLEGQCGPSWSLLDPIMEITEFAEFQVNLDKTPSDGLPLTTLSPPGDKQVTAAAADGSPSPSKGKSQAAQHSFRPSALPLSQELYRCLLCSSPGHCRFAITWKEDRSFCAAFHHSQTDGLGKANVSWCNI